jgi:hypothetical protein
MLDFARNFRKSRRWRDGIDIPSGRPEKRPDKRGFQAVQYLCMQRQKYGADGASRHVIPIVKRKDRKYGPVVDSEVIGRKTPTLITGAHDSGKSRMLQKLHEEERAIWGKKIDAAALWLGALRPLGAWSDADHIAAWWDARATTLAAKVGAGGTAAKPDHLRPWAKLKAWERAEALPDYLRDTGAVLFIDDAHKLAGRKLQIARECALTAKVWIASASDEQRIPPNLRSVMMRRDPQVIRLGTDVAYDATNVLTWILALVLLASGAWEASIVVAGLKALSGGRQAARQDA